MWEWGSWVGVRWWGGGGVGAAVRRAPRRRAPRPRGDAARGGDANRSGEEEGFFAVLAMRLRCGLSGSFTAQEKPQNSYQNNKLIGLYDASSEAQRLGPNH